MYKIVNKEIEIALKNKGYNWEVITIRSFLGYTNLYEIKLNGKLVEIYDTKKKAFED